MKSTDTATRVRGDRIAHYRKQRNLSQSALARRMSTQPHVTSVSDWERGDNQPSARHLVALAKALGVSVAALTTDDDDEESDSVSPAERDIVDALRRLVTEARQ